MKERGRTRYCGGVRDMLLRVRNIRSACGFYPLRGILVSPTIHNFVSVRQSSFRVELIEYSVLGHSSLLLAWYKNALLVSKLNLFAHLSLPF